MAMREMDYRLANSQAAAAQAKMLYEQQAKAFYNHQDIRRGAMRPASADPDVGTRDYGNVVEMVYDDIAECYVEQRQIAGSKD